MGPLNLYTQPTACNLKNWLGDFHWIKSPVFHGKLWRGTLLLSKQAISTRVAVGIYWVPPTSGTRVHLLSVFEHALPEALLQTSFSKPRDKQHELLLEKVVRRECLPIQWAQQPPHSAHLVPNWNEGWWNRSSSGSTSLIGPGSYVAFVNMFLLHNVT